MDGGIGVTGSTTVEGLAHSTIEGDIAVDLREAIDRFGLVDRPCRTRCSTGDRFEGHWRGVSVADLLLDADPTTTHVVAESADGFRACIDVLDAMDGIVAVERLDVDATGDGENGLPRLVVPGCLGTRMVKRVTRLETRQLDSTADPEELERLDPESAAE